jgi:diadenosine tetraphosphatase ApaH/serine/threonine PP2A family protein phosphatase
MTESFGFADECRAKLVCGLCPAFLAAFCCFTIAAVVDDKVFCVHRRLSPVIRGHTRDRAACGQSGGGAPGGSVFVGSVGRKHALGESSRGQTYTREPAVARAFMDANGIAVIIRAHQVAYGGRDFPFEPNRSVAMVFSAPRTETATRTPAHSLQSGRAQRSNSRYCRRDRRKKRAMVRSTSLRSHWSRSNSQNCSRKAGIGNRRELSASLSPS